MHITNLTYKGKIYPSKEITLGFCPPRVKKASEKEYDRAYDQQFDQYEEIIKHPDGTTERKLVPFFSADPNRFIKRSELAQKNTQDFKRRCRGIYGQNGITSYGRRAVRSSAALLEKRYRKEKLGFLTLTLPNFSPDILKYICSGWSQITKNILEKIKRKLISQGGSEHLICVTEIQEKRWTRRQEIGLHLHIIFQAHKGDYKYFISADWFRSAWKKVICNYLEKIRNELHTCGKENTEAFLAKSFDASVDIQRIKKSASAYLSKYMSKGSKVCGSIKEYNQQNQDNPIIMPGQWWNLSGAMRTWLKTEIKELDALSINILINEHDWLIKHKYCTYWKVIEVLNPKTKRKMVVGFIAGLSQTGYEFFRDLATSSKLKNCTEKYIKNLQLISETFPMINIGDYLFT